MFSGIKSLSSIRRFSTTVVSCNHYDTLSLPRSASKTAVKASFYKLSKRYHPDVNPNDKSAKEKFQAVSEAYSVLGNDRRRRAYDRELSAGTLTGSPSSHPYHHDTSAMYENRGRSSGFAWDKSQHRHRHGSYTTYTWTYSWGGTSNTQQQHERHTARNPFSSANVRRSTGQRTPHETKEDLLRKEPAVVRVAQVLGILIFIVALNGSFSATT